MVWVYDTWDANVCHIIQKIAHGMTHEVQMSVTHKIQKIPHGMTHEVQMSVTHKIQKIPHGMTMSVWHVGCKCVSQNPEDPSWYDTWGANGCHSQSQNPEDPSWYDTRDLQLCLTESRGSLLVWNVGCHILPPGLSANAVAVTRNDPWLQQHRWGLSVPQHLHTQGKLTHVHIQGKLTHHRLLVNIYTPRVLVCTSTSTHPG